MKNLSLRKIWICLIVFIALIGEVYAYNVTGRVLDAKGEPLVGAGVALYRDSVTRVTGTTTGIDGSFTLKSEVQGALRINVMMVGYARTTVEFVANGGDINLGGGENGGAGEGAGRGGSNRRECHREGDSLSAVSDHSRDQSVCKLHEALGDDSA